MGYFAFSAVAFLDDFALISGEVATVGVGNFLGLELKC